MQTALKSDGILGTAGESDQRPKMTRLHSADQEAIVIERAAVTSTNTEVSLKVRTV